MGLGEGQAPRVKKLFKEAGFINIDTQKDLAGIERVVYGYMPD